MRTLQRWTDSVGDEWACAEYDHGPMCRRCIRVADETTRLCLENVERGYFEIVGQADGEFQMRVTEEGERRVKGLLGEN